MFPNYDKSQNDDDDKLSDIEKLEKKVKLMEFHNTQTQMNEEREAIALEYKDAIATISDFDIKLDEELKNISDKLSPKERLEKAMKLVINTTISPANAYSIMQ